jgi:hypothetical protein
VVLEVTVAVLQLLLLLLLLLLLPLLLQVRLTGGSGGDTIVRHVHSFPYRMIELSV